MHNIGSTQTEYPGETAVFEAEHFEFNEQGELGYEGEHQEAEYQEYEYAEAVFSPEMEAELAAEFLEINTEEELDQFLGKFIRKAGRAIGKVVKSPIGRAIGGVLKGVAKKALPIAGAALGNLIVPGVGGVIGGKLASAAGGLFGLELEGLSPEDREYEVARRFVQFGAHALKNALQAPPSINPAQAAGNAIAAAAQQFAPGLLQQVQGAAQTIAGTGRRARSGHWFRRGNTIVVVGA